MKLSFRDKEDLKKEILESKRTMRELEDEIIFTDLPVRPQLYRAIDNLSEKIERLNRQRQIQIARALEEKNKPKDKSWF